ncbi:dammarenediol 12-hydroxylase-like [Coffea arabica]|uniref:Dammarenediol 12-hydroxylase-like n=1 Tax=Coffea arabica TaxID=13443 RepID=A0ABM4VXL0_COFAR
MMMEFQHLLLLLWFLIPILYLFLHKFILRKKSQISKPNLAAEKPRLPPGRSGWPLVGETLDFFSRANQGCLHKFVADRRKKYSSNIFRTSLIGFPVAIFCDAEGNKFLFSNENKLFKHWLPSAFDKLFPKSNNKLNTNHSKSLRKLLAFILKGDVLREYVGEMDEVMKQHLQTDWNCERVKVSDVARKFVLKLECHIFLGIENQGKIDKLLKGIEEVTDGMHAVPFDVPGSAFRRAIKASKLMREEFEEMIRQRKIECLDSSSGKDFISHALQATDDNGQLFNEADIASHLLGALQAAYGTLHHTITNIMMYLTEHPDVYSLVLREQKEIARLKKSKDRLSWEDLRKMKYSWNVACEALRLKSPALGGFKEAITDADYGGYTIPQGWMMHWNAHEPRILS